MNGVGGILAGEPAPDPQHLHEVAAVVRPDGNRLYVNTVNEAIRLRRLDDGAEALVALRHVEVARVETLLETLRHLQRASSKGFRYNPRLTRFRTGAGA